MLNADALRLTDALLARADRYRLAVHDVGGARVIDAGIVAPGGLEAGIALARVCMADLAEVSLVDDGCGPAVHVAADCPVRACMASQYAGWAVSVGKFFAMGSGPMRAALGSEKLFDHLPGRERADAVVGVLETRKMPTAEVVEYLAGKLAISPDKLTLWVAPTGSLAGAVQVVARSLETAMHKLHELGFDLTRVASGVGIAPLPPVGKDDLVALGRTNDAILYGGRVTLYVRGDDASVNAIGPKVPADASKDYGEPFASIFERADRDFYKIDPHLFSPAKVTFVNLDTGSTHAFGKLAGDVLKKSFATA